MESHTFRFCFSFNIYLNDSDTNPVNNLFKQANTTKILSERRKRSEGGRCCDIEIKNERGKVVMIILKELYEEIYCINKKDV